MILWLTRKIFLLQPLTSHAFTCSCFGVVNFRGLLWRLRSSAFLSTVAGATRS